MGVIFMGSCSLFTSCVQEDFYEIYDEADYSSPRKKSSKDMAGFFDEPTYTCGIHCISYVSKKSLRDVAKAAKSVGLEPTKTALTGSELIKIAGAVDGVSFSGCVECETTDTQHRAALIEKLNSFGGNKVSILVLVNTHWVVGTKVGIKEKKKTGEVKYWVETIDPQDNSCNSYWTNDTDIRSVVF